MTEQNGVGRTATEELRRMLDERGVEWTNPNSCLRDDMTSWVANGFDYDAFEVPDGTLVLSAAHQDDLTPEQAIAATLGRGTCRYELKDGRYECSNCGRSTWAFEGKGDPLDPPNFCPNCGCRIEVVSA